MPPKRQKWVNRYKLSIVQNLVIVKYGVVFYKRKGPDDRSFHDFVTSRYAGSGPVLAKIKDWEGLVWEKKGGVVGVGGEEKEMWGESS
jgi:hypothetical protein